MAGLAVGHAFIPPTPGSVLVATMFGVDLGWVILIGIACGTVAMIVAGPIWGSICGKKYMVHAAISGSTNATMHIPAIAHEFGFEIDADTFDRLP